jgi:hypothetical protein
MLFAAKHPDRFGAAASFSGIVDIANPLSRTIVAAQLSAGFGTYDNPTAIFSNPIWGNPFMHAIGWHANDPTDMAMNLRSVSLYAAAGNGVTTAGELANDGPTAVFDTYIEAEVRRENDNFDAALTKEGIPHRYVKHGGGHSEFYWVPELHQWASTMMALFAHPRPDPAKFDYRNAAPSFSVWGWSFTADPGRAREFLTIRSASHAGLTLTGSGRTQVVTAALFSPGQSVRITGAAASATVARADGAGRLSFTVDLGAPHDAEQFTTLAQLRTAKGGYFTTRRVSFESL